MTWGMHIYNTQKYIFKLTLVDFHCMKETLVLQSKMVLQELSVIDNKLWILQIVTNIDYLINLW